MDSHNNVAQPRFKPACLGFTWVLAYLKQHMF